MNEDFLSVSHESPNELQLRSPHAKQQIADRLKASLKAVWSLAALVFLLSSLYFYVVTGVAKMMVPVGLIAVGVGVVKSVKVIAIDAAKRRGSH